MLSCSPVLADHRKVEGKGHTVRNLGCFRLLSDTVIKKVTSGVSVFEKHEELAIQEERWRCWRLRGSACGGQAAAPCAVGVACFACRIPSWVDVE